MGVPHGEIGKFLSMELGAGAKSVEHEPQVGEIVGTNPGRIKTMTYKIDTYCFKTSCLALLG